jgi:arsenical pump membrane protein
MTISLILLAILLSSAVAVFPLTFGKIKLNLVTVPLSLLFLLLVLGFLEPQDLVKGLLGNEQIRPWEIMVIFFTVAYVSISVDLSGILDYFAFRVVVLAQGSTKLLFLFFYLFASILTVFTSNDIVILTLTPIIFYLKNHSEVDVLPLLFASFFGANTLSMLLYIGNPTNIIIGNALGLDFLDFTRVMILPTLVAALGNGLLLYVIFRKRITQKFLLHSQGSSQIRSPYDGIASSLLLLLMLVMLMVSRSLGLSIWRITLGFALVYFLEDVLIGFFHAAKNPSKYLSELSSDMKNIYSLFGFASNRYDVFVIIRRIPWKILPFIFVIFILVSKLSELGFTFQVSQLLGGLSRQFNLLGNVVFHGWVMIILTNIINNQPASVLYSYILGESSLGLLPNMIRGIGYSVIVASNLGANLTLIGALAGVMWDKILRTKGVVVSYGEFLIYGLLITPFIFTLTLLILAWVLGL